MSNIAEYVLKCFLLYKQLISYMQIGFHHFTSK